MERLVASIFADAIRDMKHVGEKDATVRVAQGQRGRWHSELTIYECAYIDEGTTRINGLTYIEPEVGGNLKVAVCIRGTGRWWFGFYRRGSDGTFVL